MTETLWTFLIVDYVLLALFSWVATDHIDLLRQPGVVRLYQPGISELTTSENILLFMALAGAAAMFWIGPRNEEREIPPVTRHLAALFSVLAVPVRLMTDGLIDLDTAFPAFILFFSILILYSLGRSCISGISAPGWRDTAAVAALLAMGFWMTEPWTSPSRKLRHAIAAGDAARFATLARTFPTHLQSGTGLLDDALRRPDRGIIETIVAAGHRTIPTTIGERAIFRSEHLGILEFLHARGVKLTSDELFREAIRLAARSGPMETVGSYPVLAWMIRIRRDVPAESRKPASPFSRDGWQNPVAIAAAAGNADLMAFLVGQGFAIDEEVFQALARNQHANEPEIQPLLITSGFVSAPATGTAASAGATLPTPVPAPDGLDLILWSGSDVKEWRERQNNIFHYLAREWRARDPRNSFPQVDFERVFADAVARRIDLEVKNLDGLTPLWVAVRSNNFRAAVRLLGAGADPTVRDADGMTMREFCLKNDLRLLADLVGKPRQPRE
ncbi:MAG TPA: hypothetical protein PLP29_09475 [Candidatus Ozemobacteraceae bacterium]|nr:hypothetical protein [Candidatus Ozemobacteraceae bacterium]